MVVSVPFRPQIRTSVRQNYKHRVLSASSGAERRRRSDLVDFSLSGSKFHGQVSQQPTPVTCSDSFAEL